MANLIGTIGVALLLAAFLLNLAKRVSADGYAYSALNLVGAGLACYSSYLIDFVPFGVLEAGGPSPPPSRSAAERSALLENRAQVVGQIVRQTVLTHEKP